MQKSELAQRDRDTREVSDAHGAWSSPAGDPLSGMRDKFNLASTPGAVFFPGSSNFMGVGCTGSVVSIIFLFQDHFSSFTPTHKYESLVSPLAINYFNMRITQLLLIALSSGVSAILRSNSEDEKARMASLVSTKADRAHKLSYLLKSIRDGARKRKLQEAGEDLGDFDFDLGDLDFDLGDFNLGDLNLGDFDFDFGDFDFGDFDLGDLGGGFGDFDFDMCAGGDFIAFGDGGSCWCTITSTSSEGDEREYSGILDMIMDFSFILENGVDTSFGCRMPERCDTAVGVDECSSGKIACEISLDTGDFMNSSLDCDTCVEYGNSPSGDSTLMTGKTLCMDVDLCLPSFGGEAPSHELELEGSEEDELVKNKALDFDFSDIICGCSATLEDENGTEEECQCSVCGDFRQGVSMTCGDIASTCEDSGLEFIDVSDVTTLVSAANFAPRFNSVAEDDDFGKSASQGGATVSFPFFIGALAMLLLPSFD